MKNSFLWIPSRHHRLVLYCKLKKKVYINILVMHSICVSKRICISCLWHYLHYLSIPRDVNYSIWPPLPGGGGGQKYGQITCWGKKIIKRGWKKRGKMHISYPIGKRIHIFSPIDLKNTKLQQKKAEIFPLRRAPPRYNNFHLWKNRNQEGWGKNMNFKFNINPCMSIPLYTIAAQAFFDVHT